LEVGGIREIMKITGLSYRYPGQAKDALKRIDMTVHEGEFILLMGPSGGGKSTLLRALTGAIPHLYGGEISGDVIIYGRNTRNHGPKEFADLLGMVFQDPEAQLVMTSPENEVRFGLENIGVENGGIERRIEESLEITNIGNFRKRFIPEMSGGEKQKLAMASIIAMDTNILLLDEPTSQLDPKSAEEILSILRKFNEERGVTIILVEHRLERCFRFADRAVFLKDGEIVLDDRMDDYIVKARKSGGIFLPPITYLSGTRGNEVPTTVKEARKIVHNALLNNELSYVSRSIPFQTGRNLIHLSNVDFSYGNSKVLSGLDLRIREGEKIALVGRNGAGKSTLLKLMNGILKPDQGRVTVNGMDTRRHPTSKLAKICGYLSQNPSDYLHQKTVEKEIFLGVAKSDVDLSYMAWIIESLSLEEHLDTYPRDISAGERERVALASILALRPKVLALDEPTRGMDYTQKDILARMLNEEGKGKLASIVATHDVEFITAYANRVIILGNGNILADGPPKKVLPGSLLFSPQVNLATRGFLELGLREDIIRPRELKWSSKEKPTGHSRHSQKGVPSAIAPRTGIRSRKRGQENAVRNGGSIV
jgi:energy-coupling factor transport system ATP-binding protein